MTPILSYFHCLGPDCTPLEPVKLAQSSRCLRTFFRALLEAGVQGKTQRTLFHVVMAVRPGVIMDRIAGFGIKPVEAIEEESRMELESIV